MKMSDGMIFTNLVRTAYSGYETSVWDFESVSLGGGGFASPATGGNTFNTASLQDIAKRGLDVIGALAALILTLPLWALIALAVKATSKGPVFFTQERAGLHGQPFLMLKFRSMQADAEKRLHQLVNIKELAEPVYKLKNDPRVTPVGRFLRRFGLDELPQLINVLRGEMSLVGPRPEVVSLVELYNFDQRRRLQAKPGITGYQQVHNRGMPDMAARLEYDLHYLRYRCISLDLWIMAVTVFVIASGKEITY